MTQSQRRNNAGSELSLLNRYLPISLWLPSYNRSWLTTDVIAGLAIWAVTVPQGLAYAGIAGVPAQYGLYAVPLAMIAYAIFGTSRTLSVGPDSATAVLSFAVISTLAAQEASDFLALTAALALLVGILFLIFGLLRMGWVANFLANPVLKGFTQGLAIMVIVGQLPKLFGVQGGEGGFLQQMWDIIVQIPESNPATVVIGFSSLALLFLIRRFIPRAPGPLITVVLAIVVVSIFSLYEEGVNVVGTVASGLPTFGLPGIELDQIGSLITGALAIVLVGYSESLGAAKAAAEKSGEEIDPNQELIALGTSNLGSGISSGFVVAGSLSRTSVVIESRGRSQVVSLINAFLVILTLVILMPLFQNLPQATLGAIVIYAMTGMLKPGYFRRLYRVSKLEFAYASAAFLGELIFGVLEGVLMGVMLSLLALIHHASRPGTAVIGGIPGEETYRDISLHPEAETIPGLLIFRFDAALMFPNADYFSAELKRYLSEAVEPVREVLVNCESINTVDTTGADQLAKLHDELERQGIDLILAYVKDPVRELLIRSGAEAIIGPENIYESVADGANAYLDKQQGLDLQSD